MSPHLDVLRLTNRGRVLTGHCFFSQVSQVLPLNASNSPHCLLPFPSLPNVDSECKNVWLLQQPVLLLGSMAVTQSRDERSRLFERKRDVIHLREIVK